VQKEVVDLREGNKTQMQDIAEIWGGRPREMLALSRLGGEGASRTQASTLEK
jgi:hypothetical protein